MNNSHLPRNEQELANRNEDVRHRQLREDREDRFGEIVESQESLKQQYLEQEKRRAN